MELTADTLRAWCKLKGVMLDELLAWRNLALTGIEDADGCTSEHGRSELEAEMRK